MAKQEIIIKAKQKGEAYAEKMLEGKLLSKSERSGLYNVIFGAFADGYINAYNAKEEEEEEESKDNKNGEFIEL